MAAFAEVKGEKSKVLDAEPKPVELLEDDGDDGPEADDEGQSIILRGNSTSIHSSGSGGSSRTRAATATLRKSFISTLQRPTALFFSGDGKSQKRDTRSCLPELASDSSVLTEEKKAPIAAPERTSSSSDTDEISGGQQGGSDNGLEGINTWNKGAASVEKPSSRSSSSVRAFFSKVQTVMSINNHARKNSENPHQQLAQFSDPQHPQQREQELEDRVAAWRQRFATSDDASNTVVPGVIGICNHGNTCFMNAILQCLSYTDLLAEYFVLDRYKSDLKKKRQRRRRNLALAALRAPTLVPGIANTIISSNVSSSSSPSSGNNNNPSKCLLSNGNTPANSSSSSSSTTSSSSGGRRADQRSLLSRLKEVGAKAGVTPGAVKGEVSEQLATVLKSLWSLQYDPEISIRFKSLVDKHASQYKGSRQHDAQEFLLWLLDQVHEELNLAKKKPLSKPLVVKGQQQQQQQQSKPNNEAEELVEDDEVLAADALANYARFNDSFVTGVFQAQFRSSLTCPSCLRQSNTFDPFLCVSLPIPQKQPVPVFVTVVYIDQCPRQVRLGLTLGAEDTVGDLRTALSSDTGIPRERILLVEIAVNNDAAFAASAAVVTCGDFKQTFRDSQPISILSNLMKQQHKRSSSTRMESSALYCIEVPKQQEPSPTSSSQQLNEDSDELICGGAFIVLTWINMLKEGDRIRKRFGSPYTIQVSREIMYSDLQKLLLKEMAPILHDDILISAQKVPLFKIRVVDGLPRKNSDAGYDDDDDGMYLDSSVDLPMYSLAVEQAINLAGALASDVTGGHDDFGGPTHVKLVLEWDAPAKSQVVADDRDVIEEHASVKLVEACPEESAVVVSLHECFALYTKAETLGQGNAWFCPSCKRKQEVVKKMGLWSVPDVLVIHLKRFRQSHHLMNGSGSVVGGGSSGLSGGNSVGNSSSCCTTTKLTTMVDFPLDSLDMTPHVAERNNKAVADCLDQQASNMYDLYAVCYHHGSDVQGGHYTATCRNPTDGQWYSFNDAHTKRVYDREVVTEDAYILFYQKCRAAPPESSTSASTAVASKPKRAGSPKNAAVQEAQKLIEGDATKAATLTEHWVYRMPDFNHKGASSNFEAKNKEDSSNKIGVGKSQSSPQPRLSVAFRLNKVAHAAASAVVGSDGVFQRNSKKYATMPVKKSSTPTLSKGSALRPLRRSGSMTRGGCSDGEDTLSSSSSDLEKGPKCNGKVDSKKDPVSDEGSKPVVDDDDEFTRPVDRNDVD